MFLSAVPGGIAPESLTFTPLDDMIFLKWEEPVEPNGLISQYEVLYATAHKKIKKKNVQKNCTMCNSYYTYLNHFSWRMDAAS